MEFELYCRMIRIGEFSQIYKDDDDWKMGPNIVLGKDTILIHLAREDKSSKLRHKEDVVLQESIVVELEISLWEVENVWTYCGKRIPKMLMSIQVNPACSARISEQIQKFLTSSDKDGGEESRPFCFDSSSTRLERKLISIFPADVSAADFASALKYIDKSVNRCVQLSGYNAGELVLAVSGKLNSEQPNLGLMSVLYPTAVIVKRQRLAQSEDKDAAKVTTEVNRPPPSFNNLKADVGYRENSTGHVAAAAASEDAADTDVIVSNCEIVISGVDVGISAGAAAAAKDDRPPPVTTSSEASPVAPEAVGSRVSDVNSRLISMRDQPTTDAKDSYDTTFMSPQPPTVANHDIALSGTRPAGTKSVHIAIETSAASSVVGHDQSSPSTMTTSPSFREFNPFSHLHTANQGHVRQETATRYIFVDSAAAAVVTTTSVADSGYVILSPTGSYSTLLDSVMPAADAHHGVGGDYSLPSTVLDTQCSLVDIAMQPANSTSFTSLEFENPRVIRFKSTSTLEHEATSPTSAMGLDRVSYSKSILSIPDDNSLAHKFHSPSASLSRTSPIQLSGTKSKGRSLLKRNQ